MADSSGKWKGINHLFSDTFSTLTTTTLLGNFFSLWLWLVSDPWLRSMTKTSSCAGTRFKVISLISLFLSWTVILNLHTGKRFLFLVPNKRHLVNLILIFDTLLIIVISILRIIREIVWRGLGGYPGKQHTNFQTKWNEDIHETLTTLVSFFLYLPSYISFKVIISKWSLRV